MKIIGEYEMYFLCLTWIRNVTESWKWISEAYVNSAIGANMCQSLKKMILKINNGEDIGLENWGVLKL